MELRRILHLRRVLSAATDGVVHGLAYAVGYAAGTTLGTLIDVVDQALEVWGETDD